MQVKCVARCGERALWIKGEYTSLLGFSCFRAWAQGRKTHSWGSLGLGPGHRAGNLWAGAAAGSGGAIRVPHSHDLTVEGGIVEPQNGHSTSNMVVISSLKRSHTVLSATQSSTFSMT